MVLGPAEDGGYYLIALRAGGVSSRLFEESPGAPNGCCPATLERCRELGLRVELLPAGLGRGHAGRICAVWRDE